MLISTALIVILLAVGSLVLKSCALLLPLGLGQVGECGIVAIIPEGRESSLDARIAQLRYEIGTLERDLAALQCRSAVVPSSVPKTPPSQPEILLDESLPLTEEPIEPPLSPDPVQIEEPPELIDPIPDLTAEDFDRGAISVLEGCWELDSEYRTTEIETGRETLYNRWSLCFDAQGQGVERMRSTGGDTCVGPVQGRFSESRLYIIEPANLPCSNGFEIFRRELDCSLDPMGRANCSVSQPDRGNNTSTARLRRAARGN